MSNWQQTTLGAVCKAGGGNIQTGPFGSQLHASDYVESGIPSVMPQNIGDNRIIDDGIARITEDDARRLSKYRLRTNDIVYSRRGDVERRALVRFENNGWLCGTGCLKVSFGDHPVVDPAFVSYFLGTPRSREWIVRHAVGATMLNLNTKILENVPLQLPSLTEQQDVAKVLGALDDKIAANTTLGHTVEAFGSAEFARLGLDVEPTDDGILLDDLFDLNPRRTVTSDSTTIIDMKALPTASPLVEEWTTGVRKGGARFKNGDTLVARITPCLENRKTAFVDFLDDEEVGIGSTEFIIMRSKNDLPLGLSYFMAISERFRDFAIQNLVGTSGRQRVSAADLARHTLSPVDVSELQEFGKWADDNLKFLGSLREENRTLAEIRDALLPQLMSGKLRVKDAEKIVEDTI